MAYNFFSLTREHQTELPRYDDGRFSIEVEGTKHGVASIWDKEVLIYLESLLQDRINRGEAPSPIFQFTANDLFRITGSHAAGSAYERLEGALKRLKGTMVTTNLLDDDDEGGETGGFSWIDDYRIKWRKNEERREVDAGGQRHPRPAALQGDPEEAADADLRQPVLPTEAA